MNEQELKAMFKKTFNTVAPGYESPALRFFPESAKHMATYFNLKGNECVLDVATGTGHVALAMAKHLPQGQVVGIDFSDGMLAQAKIKAIKGNIYNVQFLEMDMQMLEFPSNHFDAAACAFGIFFVENMEQQLNHILEKIKSSGKVAICGFYEDAFLPLAEKFFSCIEQYGVERPSLTWKQISTEDSCISLYENVGLQDVSVKRKNLSYYLKDANEWWEIIWYAGFRGLVNQLSPSSMQKFKEEHLKEVSELSTNGGIWLNIEVLYTIGTKP